MPLDNVSNLDALLVVLGVIAFALVLYRAVPAGRLAAPRTRFTDAEITRYDRALPKYAITAGIVLVLGAAHTVVKSFPPIYDWLGRAGHAGHLVRDIANSHLIIVLGGTVAATGLAWYALPRVAKRPLWSDRLANFSYWCTLIGAGGFYVANILLGTLMGRHVVAGVPYEQVKESFGAAYAVPVGISSGIMGIGYWTFTLVAVMTVVRSRRVEVERPRAHLLTYFAVGSLGLFAGTVQGVIQVMPAQMDWLHETGAAGHYIDPVAHAHVNLVTGILVLVAGVCFAWSRAEGGRARRTERRGFWLLVPASVLFYLVFLTLGFVEGGIMQRRGVDFDAATAVVGWPHTAALITAGVLTLAGTWYVLATLLRRFRNGADAGRPGSTLVVLGTVGLFVGTLQGLIQLTPAVKSWLEAAGELSDVPNAHAQLNMLGGVLPILFGLILIRAPEILGRRVPARVERRATPFVAVGVAVYYLGAMATSLVIGQTIASGGTLDAALAAADPWLPLAMGVGGLLYGVGYGSVARFVWRSTAAYRAAGRRRFVEGLRAYESRPGWLGRIPRTYFLLAEAVSAFAGFPGLGWMMTGRSLAGLPASMVGAAIAWAVIPMATAPGTGDPLIPLDTTTALLLYLGVTTTLSVVGLALSLGRRRTPSPAPGGAAT